MIIAVPLFGRHVAPRFCSASVALVTEISDDYARRITRLPIPEVHWARRLRTLREQGVDVLLCGGFNRAFLPLATGLGLEVYWGLEGDAASLVDQLLRGELSSYHAECSSPRRRQKGRRLRGCRKPVMVSGEDASSESSASQTEHFVPTVASLSKQTT